MFHWLFPAATRRENDRKKALAWLSRAEEYLRKRFTNKPGVTVERVAVPEPEYHGHIRVHSADEVVLEVYTKNDKYYVCYMETLNPGLTFPVKLGVFLDSLYDPVKEVKRVIPWIPALCDD